MPVPRTPQHAALLRPFDLQAAQANTPEAPMEEMAPQPSSFPDQQQTGLLDWIDGARAPQAMPLPSQSPAQSAGWNTTPQAVIREPESVAATQAVPKPVRDDFIPLRLTELPQTDQAPMKPAAPKTHAEAAPFFPEDNSLLGFVHGVQNQDAQQAVALPPPQPTSFVQAARGLVSFVRKRPSAPSTETGRNMPESRRETPPAAQALTFREQPAPAAPPKTQPAAEERPSNRPSGSAVEQMQPLIPGLLASLDEAMDDVRQGFNKADIIAVETAAARIAVRADNYGLRVLARMARCVENAAKARDKDALANILPDLETAVERNRIALLPKK